MLLRLTFSRLATVFRGNVTRTCTVQRLVHGRHFSRQWTSSKSRLFTSRETLANMYGDHVSPITRPRGVWNSDKEYCIFALFSKTSYKYTPLNTKCSKHLQSQNIGKQVRRSCLTKHETAPGVRNISKGHCFFALSSKTLHKYRPQQALSKLNYRKILASVYGDHISPTTKPRDWVWNSDKEYCFFPLSSKTLHTYTHRKYQTQQALSMLHNRKTSASRYRDETKTKLWEFGISISSVLCWNVMGQGTCEFLSCPVHRPDLTVLVDWA